jgi:type II secretory pathway component GspD/PulD (secretin)
MSLAVKQISRQHRQALRLFLILLLVLPAPGFSQAQEKTTSSGERVIVCTIQIEHADAEYLASVLEPFLSPEGSIVPYRPTNTLIIKDRAPVVNMLSEVIKGKPCIPISHPSDVEAGDVREESLLDQ